MKVVINVRHGGFSLSKAAYEKLIEWGVPVRPYVKQKRGPDGLYQRDPSNEGEIILDYGDGSLARLQGHPYGADWLENKRDHPLLVRLVEELGREANGECASLRIVEIPDDVDWQIEDYDGAEHIAERHRTWE